MKFEYLLFNLLIVCFPTLGVLCYRNAVWPVKKLAYYSILAISVPYVIWDQMVTDVWWRFNDTYTLGPKLGKLPFEELLFFLVVPWSCLVIWENLKTLIKGSFTFPFEVIGILAGFLLCVQGIMNVWWYTFAVGVITLIFVFFSIKNGSWLRQKASSIFMIITFFLILIFNGYLTGRPVVIYESFMMSNIRVFTVPIEDIFYGLVLVGGVVMIYDFLEKRVPY